MVLLDGRTPPEGRRPEAEAQGSGPGSPVTAAPQVTRPPRPVARRCTASHVTSTADRFDNTMIKPVSVREQVGLIDRRRLKLRMQLGNAMFEHLEL